MTAIASIYAGKVADTRLSADSSTLFVSSGTTVTAIALATGEELAHYDLGHAAGALDVSADGKYLFVSNADRNASFDRIALGSGRILNVTLPQAGQYGRVVHDLGALADGSLLISLEGRNPLLRYDFASRTATSLATGDDIQLVTSDDHSTAFAMFKVLAETSAIVTADDGLTALVSRQSDDPYSGASVRPLRTPLGAISRDGSLVYEGLYAAIRDATLTSSGEQPRLYGPTVGATFSNDGAYFYTLTSSSNLFVVDMQTRALTACYRLDIDLSDLSGAGRNGPGERGNLLQISDDGATLVATGGSHVYRIDLAGLVPITTAGDDTVEDKIGRTIYGLDGNDTITGNYAAGGRGDDVYITSLAQTGLSELPGEGIDEQRSAWWFTVLGDNIEKLTYVGTGNATLIGNALDNVITGGAGDDTLLTGGGDDRLDGGPGSDTVQFGGASVTVDLAVRGPQATGDGLVTLVSIENATGGIHDDILFGTTGANVLDGDYGNDLLDGRGGADTLRGGVGNDTYHIVDGHEVIEERFGEGYDTVRVAFSYVLPENVEILRLGGKRALNGTGNASDNLLVGNGAANHLDGGDGRDTLRGGGGDDVLSGADRDIFDDHGDDVLEGGSGFDIASYADATAGVFVTLGTTARQDTRGAGHDILRGIEGLTGSAFGDRLAGNAGANVLRGGQGNDRLDGNAGDDVLIGGSGADMLAGGAGIDRLEGGKGADRFVFATGDLGSSADATDQIVDFVPGEDRIELWAIDADSLAPDDQPFIAIGSAAFGHHAGELRWVIAGRDTVIQADLDGDGHGDLALVVGGTPALSEADFVL